MGSTTATITAREYLRVSDDKSGRARSVTEQHADNLKHARDRATFGTPYVDNSVSASRYSKKDRPGFVALLHDLESGRFDADELWLWEPSRASRRLGEWERLLDACEEAGVAIHVTTHARTYDPGNARDRRTLSEDATDSAYESAKVSARSRRAAAEAAAAGQPHGVAPFGYRRTYDPATGRMVGQEPHPAEAPIVVEVFTRLRQGHSLRSIEKDFRARGIVSRDRTRKNGDVIPGIPFSSRTLRGMALTPAYAGLRVHDPEGRKQGRKHGMENVVPATWEPLITLEDFYAVRAILTRPERKTTRPGRGIHLLSMIAQCGVCHGPLSARTGRTSTATEEYACHRNGHVRVDKQELDAVAEEVMLTFLTRPDNVTALHAATTDDAELQQVRDDLATARSEQDNLRTAVATGTLTVQDLAAIAPALEARIKDLTNREQDMSTPTALHGFLGHDDARAAWDLAPMSTRREIARLLLADDMIGTLRVVPRPPVGNVHVPAAERIAPGWPRTA